ncbi:MAG: thioredoxin [Candidatus Bathyarchaeia archaeon]|jgi:thioredoxin 1
MAEENDLDQIRLRKTQAMLDQAKNSEQANNQPMTVTDYTFDKAVQTHDLLVVDFWAPWCGPCRMVGPIIEALSAEYAGKVAFGKMNVDENQIVPSSFRIMSIPTIIIFNHGKEVERLVGAYPKAHIEAMIKRYLA